MQGKKKNIWLVITISIVTLVAVATTLFVLHEKELDETWREAVRELEDHIGEYDEQSIVLQNTSKAEAEKLAELFGATLRITQNGKFATLTLPEGVTIREVYAREESRPYIGDMAADYQVSVSEIVDDEEGYQKQAIRPQYSVSDEDYELQTYLDFLNMGAVWESVTGFGVTVAIIDTGIDTDHPEFSGRISEYSYNASEDKIVKDYLLSDGSYDWSLVEDEQGHGTAVTGVIAASMNSGSVVGIAPDVEIIVIKAECNSSGSFYRTSDLVFGLYYAIERDVDVVNMSFGSIDSCNPFAGATQLAYDSDVICVAAAGNSATSALTWPAADKNVIGVGALDENWVLTEYSNYGENTDIVAPGSTYTTLKDGGYGTKEGTSLASPIVVGAIALFMQENPYSTFDEVAELLYASGCDLGELGRDWEYGFGALDVGAFILGERGTVTYNMLTDELDNMEGLFIRGHALQEIPEPERLYSVFDGWYYDDTYTQEYNYYEDKFYGDITLYAKWANEDDGIPYTYVILDDGTVEICSYTGHRRYITIPEKIEGRVVTSIGDGAFADQSRLREVTLPSGLMTIGNRAFENCTNLVSIQIPEGVTTIGAYAFSGASRLSAIAFMGNSKLTSIGAFAFMACGHLETIELPAKLKNIDGSVFYGTVALEKITVQQGNTAFMDSDGVLFNAVEDTLVAYPASHGNSYVLADTIETIGNYAFAYAQLSTINFANVKTIGDSAFAGAALENVDIPDSVVSLGGSVFLLNEKLTQLTLGKGLDAISRKAFMGCTALTEIVIPGGIGVIGDFAFAYSGIRTVQFEENSGLIQIGMSSFAHCAISEIDIPSSVKMIGEEAFLSTPVARVGLAEDSCLQYIGASAFAECWLLQNIDLPNSLQTIGDFSFHNSGLVGILLPAGLTDLGEGAFAGCDALETIEVEAGNTVYHDVDGVVYNLASTEIYAYPSGNKTANYVLLDTVETVMPWAFSYAAYLEEVTLPESLVQISEYGFAYCDVLQTMHIPDNVMQIGRYAFVQDWQLHSVTFNETAMLPRISYGAFAYSGLTEFTVPAGVSTVAQAAFEGCKSLASITFASNSKVDSLSAYMFDGCENIETITFLPGSSLTSVQAHALEGMTKLTTLDFGDAKIKNIDNFAFRFCESLSTVNLPETVESIGRYAFYGCKTLSELSLPKTVEHIGSYAFLGTNSLNLYLLSEIMPIYLDENWDQGIRGYYTGVKSVVTDGDYKYAVLESGNTAIIEYLGEEKIVNLTDVDFGAPIIAIGGGAFKDSGVTSVVLPGSLNSIQAEAFAYSDLTSVTVPAGVTFIGREAFAYTPITSLSFEGKSQLKVMEQYAFAGTEELTTVVLPASLEMMGTGAFLESGLTSVTFAEGIQLAEIPQKAFADTRLSAVELPDSVTLVNHGAFSQVTTLKSVSFGENEGLRLMSNAFYQTGLTSLHIPANVTYIGEYCFVALSDLQNYTVDEENPNYTSVDGLLLTKDERKLIAVPAGRTGSLTVPLSVEEIGFGAFEESKLTKVLFHEEANVLSLGYRAFFGAENLTEITIPASVVSIDYYAFAYCEKLQTVIFAEGNRLKGIYEGAFCGDINLANIVIPASVVEISEFAFYGCAKLDQIPIGENNEVEGIYDYAFAYTGLNGEFTTPETLLDIGNYAFMGTKVTKVVIPDTKQKELVIGIGVFEDCIYIEEITVPFIGASFEDENISWFGYIFGAGSYRANDTYLPKNLKTVNITEGITFVGRGGFAYVSTPSAVNLPYSITEVGYEAFVETESSYELTNIIGIREAIMIDSNVLTGRYFGEGISGTLHLGEGITSIASSAFYGCDNLEKVVMPKSLKTIESSAFGFCDKLERVELQEGLIEIGDFAFGQCRALAKIDLPESITKIGERAFEETGITHVTIPVGVALIPEGAFVNCRGLTEITLPENVKGIEDLAFFGCENLYVVNNKSEIELQLGDAGNGYISYYAKLMIDEEGNQPYKDEDSGFEIVDTPEGFRFIKENSRYKLKEYLGDQETVTLPASINGNEYSVYYFNGAKHVIWPKEKTTINYDAFNGSTTLVSITIPDTVKTIENSAFENCAQLKSIKIPESVTTMGDSVFRGCVHLQDVELSGGLSAIPLAAFWGCTSLECLVVPEGINSIGAEAFRDCTNLVRVDIPDGVKWLGSGVFENCTAMTRIEIPESVESLGTDPFPENVSVIFSGDGAHFQVIDGVLYNKPATEIITVFEGYSPVITIPDGVTEIPFEMFKDCKNLQNIYLPDSIKSIEANAFSGCSELLSITIPEGVTSIKNGTFEKCSKLEAVILPEGVTRIWNRAFSYCHSLSSVVIPQSVERIDSQAFVGCIRLEKLAIPGNISYVGTNAFSYNTEIVVDGEFLDYQIIDGIMYDKALTEMISVCNVLPSVEIPEGVTSIPANAFANCKGLVSITIPESMEEIGSSAFYECTNLCEVRNCSDIELSFDEYGGVAYNAKVLIDKEGNKTYREGVEGLEIIYTPENFLFIKENDSYRLVSYLGVEEKITLPEDINGCSYQLSYFRGAKQIIIPEGVTEIGDYAFYQSPLESVIIPDGVTYVGKYAFSECDKLKEICIPDSVQTIEEDAFYACRNLCNVVLGTGIKTIGIRAFKDCENLSSINIPESVTLINGNAFAQTALEQNEQNWSGGMLVLDDWLIAVKSDTEYLTNYDDIKGVASSAYNGCGQLKNAIWSGSVSSHATEIETLIVSHDMKPGSLPVLPKLKNVIIRNTVSVTAVEEISAAIANLSEEVTIFVEFEKDECGWDKALPGWSGGRRVVYIDQWSMVNFYSKNDLISSTPLNNAKIILRPMVEGYSEEGMFYDFAGWDTNGDGIADSIPATPIVDINAHALYEKMSICEKYGHSFTTYITDNNATIDADGTKTAKCDRCDETDTIADIGSKLVISSISITAKPAKLNYTQGESLSTSGMVVYATYSNGSGENVAGYTISGYDANRIGSQTITVTYFGKTATFTVTVASKVPDSITSSKYTVRSGMIRKIAIGTTVSAFKGNLNEEKYIRIFNDTSQVADSALIGTGMMVKLMDGSTVKCSVVAVVTGDTNGDGKITITDMIAIKAHVLKKTILADAYAEAADTNGDGKVTITDFIQTKAHILGKSSITAQ